MNDTKAVGFRNSLMAGGQGNDETPRKFYAFSSCGVDLRRNFNVQWDNSTG
ncbi:hypothetical protein GCM10007216_28580 [Thalassobacillus devorans]|uniref:Uncharacterized protein n=1 Tax=Thalassobacillus devorans TaxID=279813 RepID=A0ABQ1PFB2_9BACI|nr:hypothetical protein [Thalassobacillus devorans]GGC96107.1 hypothetical protein GCM10007216_28580 [Thalassobacillus devorans]